jgi:hypothetical protein
VLDKYGKITTPDLQKRDILMLDGLNNYRVQTGSHYEFAKNFNQHLSTAFTLNFSNKVL